MIRADGDVVRFHLLTQICGLGSALVGAQQAPLALSTVHGSEATVPPAGTIPTSGKSSVRPSVHIQPAWLELCLTFWLLSNQRAYERLEPDRLRVGVICRRA